MSNLIEVTIDDTEVRQMLDRIQRAGLNLGPLMKTLAMTLKDETEHRFETEGPGWPTLSDSTKQARTRLGHWPGPMLQVSGQLAASISTESGADFARIGSSKVYAAIQQLGGPAGRGRKVTVPARPYLPMTAEGELTPQARDAVLDDTMAYLKRAAGV
jgi:phage virion morphogenesis protein